MYRRMCFNVFAHNRDDHSKNFSILLGHGEAEQGGADKSSILCDIVESLIGATFIQIRIKQYFCPECCLRRHFCMVFQPRCQGAGNDCRGQHQGKCDLITGVIRMECQARFRQKKI